MPGDQSMKPCLKKKKVVTFNVRIGNCDDIKEVFYVDKEYHEVFVNDEEFSADARKKKQLMVVDIGCPRSLLGFEEYERFKDSLSSCELRKVKEFEANEKFRFGPSRVYDSRLRIEMPLNVKGVKIAAKFFVVDGKVPILIGNDILEPLGAIIYTENGDLEFSKLGKTVTMAKTRGGHFVIPVEEIKDWSDDVLEKKVSTAKNNILGSEADAVMLVLFAECSNEEEFWKLHELMGHTNFTAMLLEEDEKKQITKVHRYFGHRTGRKIWEIFAKAGHLRNKKKAVLDLLDNCKVCCTTKKTPPRPKVGMPVANTFNEIVGLDLKVLNKSGEYILWMVDMFSKAIKGKHIKDKDPETIVAGIIESWIVGNGFGPGHPSKAFYSDNGGEFLNTTVVNFAATMNTTIRMTSANAPWQNGLVERHHATADIIFEKLRTENPDMDPQTAVNHAAFAKNSDVNVSGFSPLQIIMGQNPSFPGLAEVTPASSNLDSSSKVMKALKTLDEVRVEYRKHDCDTKLKKVRSQRINPCVERSYNMGDPVIFRDTKKKEWKHGTALVRFGKTLYLRFGNWLRRVPIDTVMPDPMGAEKVEESFVEPADADQDEDRFKEEEVPVVDLEKDLESALEINTLLDKVKTLEEELKTEKLNNAKHSNADEEIVEESSNLNPKDTSNQEIRQRRTERRKKQKLKKTEQKKVLPTYGQTISFKEYNSDIWRKAKVSGVFKKTSIHKNIKQLTFSDGFQTEVDFENDVEDWKPLNLHEENEEETETFVTETDLLSSLVEYDQENIIDAFPVNLVPRNQYGNKDVQNAMLQEIQKYKTFNAFEEVDDEGQESLPVRWVVTRHEIDGKNQPLKARMCIRGDLEKGKDDVRADSPTVGKETLKLALTIAANEGFTVKSGDIKSAYLQGLDVERQILVKPPPQAGVFGKLWQLRKGAYGISDGGRLFNLRLVRELKALGMHQVHADGTLFSYVREGKLHGLIVSHVDDLLIMGDALFESEIEKRLAKTFIFSKIEEKSFKYCGCQITVEKSGDILLDQIKYVDTIEEIDRKSGHDDSELNRRELKQLRGKIGEILWISLMTRPDLAFDVNKIASEVQ